MFLLLSRPQFAVAVAAVQTEQSDLSFYLESCHTSELEDWSRGASGRSSSAPQGVRAKPKPMPQIEESLDESSAETAALQQLQRVEQSSSPGAAVAGAAAAAAGASASSAAAAAAPPQGKGDEPQPEEPITVSSSLLQRLTSDLGPAVDFGSSDAADPANAPASSGQR